MTRSLAVVAGLAALAVPSAATAAPSLTVSPQKRCYASGESINLMGTGFSSSTDPANPEQVSITRDNSLLGQLETDANGAFNGVLTLAQNSGRQVKTYKATDQRDASLTASAQITVSSVLVKLSPENGAPGRRMKVNARGFTTGKTLWAHIRRGKSKRNLKIGRLTGACGTLTTRRRLLPRDAAIGVHTIQFDTFRRYKADRPVSDHYTITVS